MPSHILYSYSSVYEVEEITSRDNLYAFVFQETKELLEDNPEITLDITSLMHYLGGTPRDQYAAYINLREITDKTKVVVREDLAHEALEVFYMLFDIVMPLVRAEEDDSEKSIVSRTEPVKRRHLFIYGNSADMEAIIQHTEMHQIPLITFSQASGDKLEKLELFYQTESMILIDFTSICHAIEGNKSNLFIVEQFLNRYCDTVIIIQADLAQALIEYLPLYFDKKETISSILPDVELQKNCKEDGNRVKTVTSISSAMIDDLENAFNSNLVGHQGFKQDFFKQIRNFRILNRIGEQRVFSVFLFGKSGIGKTEAARALANGLSQNGYLAKINFQNYSSQDALNSLIGSPRGYIGSDQGELSSKINKSKIGVVLLDEFEKTTYPVFSFFLELLEEGKFTDSMANEYDLDGYVLIFTSNITSANDYKQLIPAELQTRFDLVCEFNSPLGHEKQAFVDFLISRAADKFSSLYPDLVFSDLEKEELCDFDYSGIEALRDIKKVFNQRMADLLSRKGVKGIV